MPTQQIAKDQWEHFLSAFSANNQTRPVDIDIESTELGPQKLVEGMLLIGIETELKDESNPTIIIVTGDSETHTPSSLTHQVNKAQAIWVKEDNEGCAQALDIETEDGKTIIQFR